MTYLPAARSHLARSVLRPLVLLLALTTALIGPVGAVTADPLPATTLTLSAPASAKAGQQVPFTAVLKDASAAAIVGATVSLQRLSTSWQTVGTGTTSSTGQVVINATLPAGSTQWRAAYAGDTTHAPSLSPEVTETGQVLVSTLTLSGPTRLVDEKTATLKMSWHASDGTPVDGVVTVRRRISGRWSDYKRLRTSSGKATLKVRPRHDSKWRVRGAAGVSWKAAASDFLAIDNLPPVTPVAYPRAAPNPRSTAAQARATGAGAHAVITKISNSVWRSMVGRTWHSGCPLGRGSLRLLRINYWGFNGYRYRGEIVLSSAVVARAARAFRDMYNGHYPIRRMYRVDHFGYSKKAHGGDDFAAMRADDTSGFNCRSVDNRPGVLSPHARGRAIDVNTWENPYHSAGGVIPDRWWASHSNARVAWRSSSHPVVRIWRAHGFHWTYGNADSQHLDGRSTTTLMGSFTG